MAARAHRRVGCTIAERTRCGARQAMVRNIQGRWSMQPVPGGYKIRPYSVDGGACGRRSGPDPGGWRADVGIGPYEAEPSNPGGNRNLVPGGHKARPYGKTGGGAVGADFISARAHRRVGCTIVERTRCGARQAMVRNTQGRWSMQPVLGGYTIRPYRGGSPDPRRKSGAGFGRPCRPPLREGSKLICGWRRLRWPASRRSGRRRRRGWWGCRRRPRTRGRAPGGRRGRGR